MNEMNPPAKVSTARAEQIANAKAINKGIDARERMNLDDAIALGKILLALTKDCAQGDKEKIYAEIVITRDRAAKCMRVARIPARDLAKCESISAALEMYRALQMQDEPEKPVAQTVLRDADEPPAELQAQRAAQYGGKQGVAAAALASISPAPDKQKLCDRCRANPRGPVKDCQACASLTRPAERDAGDDTEQIAAEKRAERQAVREHNRSNGRYFDPKAFTDPLGKLVRALDDFGTIYQIKESTEVAALRRRMEELLTEFQNLAKKTAKMEVK